MTTSNRLTFPIRASSAENGGNRVAPPALLNYAPTRWRPRRQRGRMVGAHYGRISIVIGAIAMAVALASVRWGPVNGHAAECFLAEGALVLAGVVIATFGRRSSPAGRRDAIIGRRLAVAAPLVHLWVGVLTQSPLTDAALPLLLLLTITPFYCLVAFLLAILLDGFLRTE